MKTKDFAVTGFVVLLGALLAYLWLAPAGHPMAPQASFTDLQGKQFTLQDLRGKPVIINFWATTCPGCVKEIPAFTELYKEHAEKNLVIIGVAMDYDPESQVREMVRRKQMPYTIVLDTKGELAQAFDQVSLTPTTFFINKNGQIVTRKLGEMTHAEMESNLQNMLL